MTFPLLTSRTRIAPLSMKDVDSFVSYRKDPSIARFQSWDESYSIEQAKELIKSQEGVIFPAKGDWLQLAIHRLETGELLGDLALHALEEDHSFEIGFTIASHAQKNGFGNEAAERLLSYLFEDFSAKRVIASTDSRNLASIKLLVSLGFTQDQEKTFVEEFKNETVTVFTFELTEKPQAKK